MRTAEEYLDNANGFFYTEDFVYHKESVKKIINEARRETIQASADIATGVGEFEVGQLILSLINELK